MLKELPELTVASDLRHKVEDVEFRAQHYATYLENRGAPAEEIANLSIVVTNEGLSPAAVANYSSAYEWLSEDDSVHKIRFSSRVSSNEAKQGSVLRHESEHFICDARRSPFLRNLYMAERVTMFGACVLGAAGLFGVNSAETIAHAMDNEPETLRLAAITLSGLGGAVLGGLGGGLSFSFLKSLSPEEVRAYWAQISRYEDLPDGTLRIAFR